MTSTLTIEDFLVGPDIILANTFRLLQMPVDANDRQLGRRLQTLQKAEKMAMAPPPGRSPLFALGSDYLQGGQPQAALHKLRDPAVRLVNEMFWFWPMQYGEAEGDEGLRMVEAHQFDDAAKFWQSKSDSNHRLVGCHNLAVLNQVLALDHDQALLAQHDETPESGAGDNGQKPAVRHWQDAYKHWQTQIADELFWGFVADRIRALEDPRLPQGSESLFRQHIPSMLASINVGVIRRAAKRATGEGEEIPLVTARMTELIKQHWSILRDESSLEANAVDRVIKLDTERDRDRIKRLSDMAYEQSNREPLGAAENIERLLEQVRPTFALLEYQYPDDGSIAGAMRDVVAETILYCQVLHGRKTEDWVKSTELLDAALEIASGADCRAKIERNQGHVKSNLETGSIWCLPGYFELPEDCQEILERARSLEDGGSIADAIELLRNILLGVTKVSTSEQLEAQVKRSLAICLKTDAVSTYNKQLASFDTDINHLLTSSVRHHGYVTESGASCSGCGCIIYGTYYNRSINGDDHPFCTSCDNRLVNTWEQHRSNLIAVTQRSLDLMVIAFDLDPTCTTVVNNLTAFRNDSNADRLTELPPLPLKIKHNFLSTRNIVRHLAVGEGDENELIGRFANLIESQSGSGRTASLDLFIRTAVSDPDRQKRYLPAIFENAPLFHALVHFAVIDARYGAAESQTVCDAVRDNSDYRVIFAMIALLEEHSDQSREAVDNLLGALDTIVAGAATEDITSSHLSGVLLSAKNYSSNVYSHLVTVAIRTVAESGSTDELGIMIRFVQSDADLTSVFYSSVFFSEQIYDPRLRTNIVTAIDNVDPELRFAILEHLREMGDLGSPTVKQIMAKMRDDVAAEICQLICKDINGWFLGRAAFLLEYAKHYSEQFESEIFTQVIRHGVKSGACLPILVAVATRAESDRGRFLTHAAPESRTLDREGKIAVHTELVNHWDPQLRSFALRRFPQGENPGDRMRRLIRVLDEEDPVDREYARNEIGKDLRSFVDHLTDAASSCSERQLIELLTICELAWENAESDVPVQALIKFNVRALGSPTAIRAIQLLKTLAPHGITGDCFTECVRWLKFAATKPESAAGEASLRILEAVKSVSLRNKMKVWFTKAKQPDVSQGAWCTPVFAPDPWNSDRQSDDPPARTPKDAREYLGSAVYSTPGGSSRKAVLDMARSVHGDSEVICPICNVKVKSKNIVKHYDRNHRDAE